jgi:hypothetical protein
MQQMKLSVYAALLLLLLGTADAFSPARLASFQAATSTVVAMAPPREEETEETKTEYLLRLQEAARDPKKFEQFVMKKDDVEPEPAPAVEPKKGGGYQRIEEWDAQRSRDDMSWEERVQFDGQRNGNQFRQNEILRRNLKAW